MSQIEKSEQRFVIKFFFVTNVGTKAIHRELTAVFAPPAYLLRQVKE
jgi:hypothetical protein